MGNKAEKKTMKRLAKKQNQFGSTKSNWRSLQMEDPDEESTDTEDEDDYQETTKFLSLIEKAKQKNTKVSIKWVNGQVKLEREQEGLEGELSRREKELRLKAVTTRRPNIVEVKLEREQDGMEGQFEFNERNRRQMNVKLEANSTKSRDIAEFKTNGKRKFEERMTLNGAKAEDFNDSQDYVNFIQTKLQGVRIKLTK